MRQAATAIFTILSAIMFVALASQVASRGLVETGASSHINVNAPDLWPTEPVRVNVASQNYERIAPAGYQVAVKGQRVAPTQAFEASLVAGGARSGSGFDVARFNG